MALLVQSVNSMPTLKRPVPTLVWTRSAHRPGRYALKSILTTCRAQDKEGKTEKTPTLQGAAAAALAASILLSTAAVPSEALAARSGGRVGGSSFRSAAPRSAAPRAAPRAGPTVRNYNYNMSPAPPLVGGYGGGYGYGYGGGGISLFPTFLVGGGGIFQFFIVAMIATTILGAIRGLVSSRRRDDDWED